MSAAIAGRFGVPVVMISGDDVAVREAQQLIGSMEGAVVKQAIGFHSTATRTPEAAQAIIGAKARVGLTRRRELRPYVLKTPVRLDITFKNYRPAEILSFLPIVQRTTAHSIRFVGRDVLEVSKFIAFVMNYTPEMAP